MYEVRELLDAQEAAGLEKTRHDFVAGDALFRNLKKVWAELGRQPKLAEMRKPLSSYKGSVYVNIFGTWWSLGVPLVINFKLTKLRVPN